MAYTLNNPQKLICHQTKKHNQTQIRATKGTMTQTPIQEQVLDLAWHMARNTEHQVKTELTNNSLTK